ncbi:MAG: hypothetical protein MJ171_00710 [Clostridia bacterium]|nr:hypothetical protein [Clostridia bacterium]
MYNIYLNENDKLNDNHYPLIALLNEASNENIIEFIENLLAGNGTGYDYSNCTLWNELDDYDKLFIPKFDGIMVENEAGEEIIVEYEVMHYYLEKLCNLIKFDSNEMQMKMLELVNAFKEKYCRQKTLEP